MPIMQCLEIPPDRVPSVRQMIPIGVEHYVLRDKGFTYINLRTNDHSLVRRLIEAARGGPSLAASPKRAEA